MKQDLSPLYELQPGDTITGLGDKAEKRLSVIKSSPKSYVCMDEKGEEHMCRKYEFVVALSTAQVRVMRDGETVWPIWTQRGEAF